MAKSVSLTGDKPTAAEMLARVTGQKKSIPGIPVAPPARAVPPPAPAGLPQPVPAAVAGAVKGKPPMPKGVPVFTPNPDALTDEERQALQSINWKPGEQVTGNIAEILAEVKAAADAEKGDELARLTGAAPTVVNFDPVDSATLPPERQAEVRRQMAETMAAVKQQADNKAARDADAGMSEGVREAMKVATAPVGIEVEDDRATAKREAPADTGLVPSHPGNCPNCGHDLATTDEIVVTDGDKSTFLQSILGEKAFSKEFDLFGGKVNATFRTLTGKEIDKIYSQVFHERRIGEIHTDLDFYERVNRYRLYLQLQSLRSNSFHHDFPEGFTPETNDTAGTFYELPEDRPEGETGLREVERYVVKTALKTEMIARTVTGECAKFNRLVSRLQAMVDNPDFWAATGG